MTPSHPVFFRSAWILCRRELFANLLSPWIYVAGAIATILETQLAISAVKLTGDLGFTISNNLLIAPFLGAIFVASLFASVIAVTCLVSEREKKTLRTLFFTPLEYGSLVLGKFLAQLLSSLAIVLLSFGFIALFSAVNRIPLGSEFLMAAVLCVLMISNMVAFSLSISTLSNTTRGAILILFATLGLLLGLQLAGRVVEQIQPLLGSSQVNYILPILDFVSGIASWSSPLAYLVRGLEAVSTQNVGNYALSMAESLVYSAFFLFAAIFLMNRRGVYK